MNELILTDEQKRFWSQENWKNLRWNGKEVNIQAVYITLNDTDYLPVCIRFRDENAHIKETYFNLKGGGIITEVKPKQMVPWGKKEFVKHRNCLFRVPDRVKFEGKEVWFNGYNKIYEDGIKWDERCDLYPFDEFCNDGTEYSPDDGATWLPCMKEE